MKTKSTPHGKRRKSDQPHPDGNRLVGATYVARGFSGKQKTSGRTAQGRDHAQGFSLVDVFSPSSPTTRDNTYQWFNPRVKILEEQGHDATDFHKALDKGYMWGEEIPIGVFWKNTDLPSLEDLEPVLHDGNGPLASAKLGNLRRAGAIADQGIALAVSGFQFPAQAEGARQTLR